MRRVGKTRLILEVLSKNDLYLFVNKDKESGSLLREYEDALKNAKLLTEFESLRNWDDFFKILFERFRGIVVFDEFQNFALVDASVYGTIQKYIDLNENRSGVLIVFSGSAVGMIKKLFSDSNQPLYGRVKRRMFLKPLHFKDVFKMCHELKIGGIEDAIRLYSVFGGFPKYYVGIEDENLAGETFEKILDRFFFMENAVLEDEASQILSLEFGRRSGVYYNILSAIACGNAKIGEVASFLRKKETALTRQMNELVNFFEFVGVEKPITGGKSLLFVQHPLLNFWFRFFYKNLSAYKRREAWLIGKIKAELNAYVGLRFEAVCREFLENKYDFERTGRWWGAYRDPAANERKIAEIDIVALSEKTSEILFCECKWQKGVDAGKLYAALKEKAKLVHWRNGTRHERYALFTRGFKNKPKEPNLALFGLEDLENTFSR